MKKYIQNGGGDITLCVWSTFVVLIKVIKTILRKFIQNINENYNIIEIILKLNTTGTEALNKAKKPHQHLTSCIGSFALKRKKKHHKNIIWTV